MNDHTNEKKTAPTDREQNPELYPETNDSSALYEQNKETGEWTIKNPAGSTAYNYLYRDDLE